MRVADGGVFLPDDAEERRMLLDVFLLQKALYEVVYELNNRPDWVRIPLRGILSLVA
jgi:maltose alpha-D-glucosyltransferase/alpha-amylase